MEIALRERNRDFRFRQGVGDRNGDVAFDLQPLIVIVGPESNFEIERIGPEFYSVRSVSGRGMLQGQRIGTGHFGQECDDALRIAPVSDAHAQLQMRRWRFDKVQLVTLSEIRLHYGTINPSCRKAG